MLPKYIYTLILFCLIGINSLVLANCTPSFTVAFTQLDTDQFKLENITEYKYQTSSACKVESFGFYKGDVILKIELLDSNWLNNFLSIDNPLLDSIQVYYEDEQHNIQLSYETGDLIPFGKRINKDFLIPIQNKSSFYIRITNYGTPLYLPLSLVHNNRLITKDADVYFYLGLLYGVIILSILFNLYLWVKRRSSIYYSLYLCVFLLLIFTLQGYSYQLLWPNSPYIQQVAVPICVILTCIFLTRFFQFFFSTQKHLPRLHKTFNTLVSLLPIGIVFCLLPQLYLEVYKYLLVNLISILFLFLYVLAFIKSWNKLNKELWLISISLLIFFLGALIYIGANFQLLPYSNFTRFSLEIGLFFEIVLLTLAISIRFKKFRQFKIEQLVKTNRYKQHENLKLSKKVEDRKREISEQSKVLEEQNSSILKSITYSYNVQKALLPLEKEIQHYIKNSFLIYQPKDIVSGDFYWLKNINIHEDGVKNNYTLVAVGDCTGHGIPGALISVLAINTLNQAVRLAENKTTEDLLNFLNDEINNIFNSNIESENIRDGLDISLIAINNSTHELHYSTAKSQIIHIRAGKLTRLKTSNNPIGLQDTTPYFSKGNLMLNKDDKIYLLSDGFADQFGGPYGKKFKINTLKSLLVNIHQKDMNSQKAALLEALNNWKGSQEQTDDITVLGISI
ncbi:7TM diverse intracellular signaling domain-containing protein [Lishizhenia sp.]|uniref:7TM diverse intracellular signaling domain-containing protein n=1 Tax=Lishizhenia sp. TaxID=2497594 RepID=UPI00299E897D|nr:7TM diverse intracellular signaling domain-containing protein [Lishizhenia sp.]MDX1445679.1 7TM diverse intracellular signaling domain-containing protein [Lishizhenia sp.]